MLNESADSAFSIQHSALHVSQIAIAGFGLIGGSVALALREVAPGARSSRSITRRSSRRRCGRGPQTPAATTRARGRSRSGRARRAGPAEHRPAPRPAVARPRRALVTDVGSTKRAIVAAASRCRRACASSAAIRSPAPRRGGFASARADLFRGRPWIFTPTGNQRGSDVERLTAFVSQFGARPEIDGRGRARPSAWPTSAICPS